MFVIPWTRAGQGWTTQMQVLPCRQKDNTLQIRGPVDLNLIFNLYMVTFQTLSKCSFWSQFSTNTQVGRRPAAGRGRWRSRWGWATSWTRWRCSPRWFGTREGRSEQCFRADLARWCVILCNGMGKKILQICIYTSNRVLLGCFRW